MKNSIPISKFIEAIAYKEPRTIIRYWIKKIVKNSNTEKTIYIVSAIDNAGTELHDKNGGSSKRVMATYISINKALSENQDLIPVESSIVVVPFTGKPMEKINALLR
jgi:hypothetical protein